MCVFVLCYASGREDDYDYTIIQSYERIFKNQFKLSKS